MLADALPASRAGQERSHCKCVPHIMQARAATAWRKICCFQQLSECAINLQIGQWLPIIGDEHILPIGTNSAAACQIAIEACLSGFVKWYQPGFLEFSFSNQEPTGSDIGELQG